jgi:hypothetical protein
MEDWTQAQRIEADAKVQVLNESETVLTVPQRSGTSASSRYRQSGGVTLPRYDVDHMLDLQLGGLDTTDNMWLLNSSVNRSLGSQIYHQTKTLPAGTVIDGFSIGD